jgi:hypothetical protein
MTAYLISLALIGLILRSRYGRNFEGCDARFCRKFHRHPEDPPSGLIAFVLCFMFDPRAYGLRYRRSVKRERRRSLHNVRLYPVRNSARGLIAPVLVLLGTLSRWPDCYFRLDLPWDHVEIMND